MRHILHKLRTKVRHLFLDSHQRRHALVGPPKMWLLKRDFQIRFLVQRGLKPGNRLLDIGCGTLRGGIPIIRYLDEGNYVGVESRLEVLEEGRAELRDAGLQDKNPELLHCPDIGRLELTKKFEFVWAFSVLIHMPDDVLSETFRVVSRRLASRGVFYANVNLGESRRGEWQGFPVVWRSLEFYQQTGARCGLEVEHVGSLADFGHLSGDDAQDQQRMLAITLKSGETIARDTGSGAVKARSAE